MIYKGAEAIIKVSKKAVRKIRNRKLYRVKALDEKIRKERNKREFKIMGKVYPLLPSPKPIKMYRYSFTMERIEGNKPSLSRELAKTLGLYLAKLHSKDIIHGDLTIANIIENKKEKKLYVIDFGLSFISKRIEDKADDLLTTERSMGNFKKYLLFSYKSNYKEGERVIERMEKIKKRARYT